MATTTRKETVTHTDKYSLRTIDRNISHDQHTGITKTIEREIVRERSFIKKEELSEEFKLVKDLFIDKFNKNMEKLMNKWIMHSFTETCKFQNRMNNMKKHLCTQFSDKITMSQLLDDAKTTFINSAKILGQQLVCIQNIGKIPNVNNNTILHRFIQMALYRASVPRQYKERAHKILKTLSNDEYKFTETRFHISPHTKTVTRPHKHIFPFTQYTFNTLEAHDIPVDGHVSKRVYQQYLELLIKTVGRSKHLMCPLIRESITYALILDHHVIHKFTFPTLIQIISIAQYKLSSIAFTYPDLWGSRKKDLEYLALCEFKIGDTIYPPVLIELPLLMANEEYTKIAQPAFTRLYRNPGAAAISRYRSCNEFLDKHPDCKLFTRLRELQQDVGKYEQDTTELKTIRNAQSKLQNTIDKLVSRSRNA
jgi:hypothetical protein